MRLRDVGRGQTRQAPVGFVKEFGLYAKGIGEPRQDFMQRAGLGRVCFEKIHLAAPGIVWRGREPGPAGRPVRR